MIVSRKTLIVATTVLATAFGLGSAANAGPIHDLPSCYDYVIGVCNDTSRHPDACIDNATSACDEEFGNKSLGNQPKVFLAPQKPERISLLLPAVQ